MQIIAYLIKSRMDLNDLSRDHKSNNKKCKNLEICTARSKEGGTLSAKSKSSAMAGARNQADLLAG